MSSYIDLYKELHKNRPTYGTSSEKLFKCILPLVKDLNPKTILDFGCGKSKLYKMIQDATGIKVERYDPAIKGIDVIPQKYYDLVICTDVLEHIHEFELYQTLVDIKMLGKNAIFNISIVPATNYLSNGQNAHVTVMIPQWWEEFLIEYYPILNKVDMKKKTTIGYITWNKNESTDTK